MTDREQAVFGVLRDADEPWLELWVIAKRAGLRIRQASCAVRALRRRGLVVKRSARGLSKIEVSLASGGVW